MKYIKSFESTMAEFASNIEKYIVWKFPSNLFVLEVINVTNSYITCLRLYKMSISSRQILKSDKDEFEFSIETAKDRIIYQSDNLQEVLDILPELPDISDNVNKYNL